MTGYVNAYVPKPERWKPTRPPLCCDHGHHVKTPFAPGIVECVCSCLHRWIEVAP